MKSKIGFAFFSIFLALSAHGADSFSKTIKEALDQEQSLFMLSYGAQRCAGFLTTFAPRLRSRNDHPEAKKMNDMADELEKVRVPVFLMYTNIALQKMNGDKQVDFDTQILKPITEMQNIYFQMMENNVLLDGNALDDRLMSDMEMCNSIYEAIK